MCIPGLVLKAAHAAASLGFPPKPDIVTVEFNCRNYIVVKMILRRQSEADGAEYSSLPRFSQSFNEETKLNEFGWS